MSNLPDRTDTVRLDLDGFKLSMRDREIALAMLLRSQTGESVREIAERFDITRDTIYKMIKNSKGEYDRFQTAIYDQLFKDLYGMAVTGMTEMLYDKTTPKALKIKIYGMILQAHGKANGGVTVNVNQPRNITLQELEQEQEIIDLEHELLDGGDK